MSSAPITITHGSTMYVNIAVNGTGAQSGTPINVSESFGNIPTATEDVSLIGTFPNGNPACNIPGCTMGAVDHFTSTGALPIDNSTPNYLVLNAAIYPLTGGTFSSATTPTAGQNFTTFLTGGTYSVVAHYGGDGIFGASSSTTPMFVTVNPEGSIAETCVLVFNPFSGISTGVVTLPLTSSPPYSCSAATSATYGEIVTIRADVIGASSSQENATGQIILTDNGAAPVPNPAGVSTSSYALNSEGYLEDQTAFLPVGSHSFQAAYQGVASYHASEISRAVAINVSKASSTAAAEPSATTIATGVPISIGAFIDTQSLGNAPTGSVTFFNGATSLGTATLGATFDTNGFSAGQATLPQYAAVSFGEHHCGLRWRFKLHGFRDVSGRFRQRWNAGHQPLAPQRTQSRSISRLRGQSGSQVITDLQARTDTQEPRDLDGQHQPDESGRHADLLVRISWYDRFERGWGSSG